MGLNFAAGTQNFPAKIIQTVQTQAATSVSTTSGSYQEITELSTTLNLQHSSNKVIATLVLQIQAYGDRDRRCEAAICHTNMSSRFTQATTGEYHTGDSSSYSFGQQTHQILVTPNASSMTFKAGFRSVDGSTVGIQASASYWRSYFVLQEVHL